MFRQALDFILPSRCTACDCVGDGSIPLCANCLADLARIQRDPACDRCGYPLQSTGDPCVRCKGRGMSPLEHIGRLAVFSDPLRGMVHSMKYCRAWPLAEFLADRLVEHEPLKAMLAETERFVPIPLHPLRQFERGYNQADVIARRLGWRCDVHVVDALCRTRQTETQVTLHGQAKRADNLRGAFDLLDGESLRGKHVTLVDDVMTTGATLRSAARALREVRPASISAIVIAVADPKGRTFTVI